MIDLHACAAPPRPPLCRFLSPRSTRLLKTGRIRALPAAAPRTTHTRARSCADTHKHTQPHQTNASAHIRIQRSRRACISSDSRRRCATLTRASVHAPLRRSASGTTAAQIHRHSGGRTAGGRVGRAHRSSAQEGVADLLLLRAAVRSMHACQPIPVERCPCPYPTYCAERRLALADLRALPALSAHTAGPRPPL